MFIRKAVFSDIAEVSSLYDLARKFMCEQGNAEQWGKGHPNGEDLRRDIEEEKSFVIVDGEEIVGTFYFKCGDDETYNRIYDGEWLNSQPYSVIHRVAIKYNGRGLISHIFDFADQYSKNIKIDTHEKNIPMQKALSKNGFIRCGTIYLKNGDGRIAYQRSK